MGADSIVSAAGEFQSTLSMRRATCGRHAPLLDRYISIHALHEESDFKDIQEFFPSYISIHALHEESDRERTAPN